MEYTDTDDISLESDVNFPNDNIDLSSALGIEPKTFEIDLIENDNYHPITIAATVSYIYLRKHNKKSSFWIN